MDRLKLNYNHMIMLFSFTNHSIGTRTVFVIAIPSAISFLKVNTNYLFCACLTLSYHNQSARLNSSSTFKQIAIFFLLIIHGTFAIMLKLLEFWISLIHTDESHLLRTTDTSTFLTRRGSHSLIMRIIDNIAVVFWTIATLAFGNLLAETPLKRIFI